MLCHIFKEIKDITNSGGMGLTLDVGIDFKHEMITIPVIWFIIRDCKSKNVLCCMKGIQSLNMNGLFRDYDIYSSDGDNTLIGKELICKKITKEDIVGRNKDETDKYVFLPIQNYF